MDAGACRQWGFQGELLAHAVALGQTYARQQFALAALSHFQLTAARFGRVLHDLGLFMGQTEVVRQTCGLDPDRTDAVQARLRIEAAGMEQIDVVDRRIGSGHLRQ